MSYFTGEHKTPGSCLCSDVKTIMSLIVAPLISNTIEFCLLIETQVTFTSLSLCPTIWYCNLFTDIQSSNGNFAQFDFPEIRRMAEGGTQETRGS